MALNYHGKRLILTEIRNKELYYKMDERKQYCVKSYDDIPSNRRFRMAW